MTKYVRKPGEVEANQFFYGRPMIPGVVYPADRSEGSPNKHAYIFIDDNDNKQFLQPGDWVVMDDDDEGNTTFYVVKLEVFDLLFAKEDNTIKVAIEALRVAVQLAEVASDWNLDEVEIDGEMVSIYDVTARLQKALTQLKGEGGEQ